MKDLIARSQTLEEVAQTKKGLVWILEFLVFLVVLFVGSLAQQLVKLPVDLAIIFGDEGYRAAQASGDQEMMQAAIAQINERIAVADWYTMVSLLSEIMLIGVVFLFCRFIQKRRLRTLGFVKKDVLKEYGLGMLLGFVFFSACVGLSLLTGGLKFGGVSPDFSMVCFIGYLAGFMVQGMAEEVLCRGYFMGSYARRYPVYAAVLANSVFFAMLHLANSGISVLAFINLTLFGIFASLYFIRRGSIWGIAAFHSVWNLVQGNFYGIRVSGMNMGNTLFSMESVEGRDLLNGGAFGMEGSLVCTIIYVAGIVWLLMGKNKDGGEIVQPIEENQPETEMSMEDAVGEAVGASAE